MAQVEPDPVTKIVVVVKEPLWIHIGVWLSILAIPLWCLGHLYSRWYGAQAQRRKALGTLNVLVHCRCKNRKTGPIADSTRNEGARQGGAARDTGGRPDPDSADGSSSESNPQTRQLQNDVRVLERTLRDTRTDLRGSEATIAALRGQLNEQHELLKAYENKDTLEIIEDLESELAESQNTVEALKRTHEEDEVNNKALRKELRDAQDTARQLLSRLAIYESEEGTATSQRDDSQHRVRELEAQRRKDESELKVAREQVNAARDQLNAARDDAQHRIREIEAQRMRDESELKATRDELNTARDQLNAARAEPRANPEEFNELRARIAEHEQTIIGTRNTLAAVHAENAELRDVAAIHAKEKEKQKLEGESNEDLIAFLKNEIVSRDRDLVSARERLRVLEGEGAQGQGQGGTSAEMQRLRESTEKALRDTLRAKKDVKIARNDADRATKDTAEAKKEAEKAKKEAEEAKKDAEKAHQDARKAQKDAEEAQKQVTELQTGHSGLELQLQETRDSATRQVQDLEAQLKAGTEWSSKAQQEGSVLNQKIMDLERELSKARAATNADTSGQQESQNVQGQLRRDLLTSQQANASLNEKNKELTAKVQSLKRHNAYLDQTLASNQDAVDSARAARAGLENKLAAAQVESENRKDEIARLEYTLKRQTAELGGGKSGTKPPPTETSEASPKVRIPNERQGSRAKAPIRKPRVPGSQTRPGGSQQLGGYRAPPGGPQQQSSPASEPGTALPRQGASWVGGFGQNAGSFQGIDTVLPQFFDPTSNGPQDPQSYTFGSTFGLPQQAGDPNYSAGQSTAFPSQASPLPTPPQAIEQHSQWQQRIQEDSARYGGYHRPLNYDHGLDPDGPPIIYNPPTNDTTMGGDSGNADQTAQETPMEDGGLNTEFLEGDGELWDDNDSLYNDN